MNGYQKQPIYAEEGGSVGRSDPRNILGDVYVGSAKKNSAKRVNSSSPKLGGAAYQ